MVENKALDVEDYVPAHLPQAVIKKLESGAFRSLCEHLRERSDEVPNIDLMTVSGFCRNCLSKVRPSMYECICCSVLIYADF